MNYFYISNILVVVSSCLGLISFSCRWKTYIVKLLTIVAGSNFLY